MNFIIKRDQDDSSLKCEFCGKEMTLEESYEIKMDNTSHYFCCEHCANEFLGSGNGHACSC